MDAELTRLGNNLRDLRANVQAALTRVYSAYSADSPDTVEIATGLSLALGHS